MRVLAIDPGDKKSAWIVVCTEDGILDKAIENNLAVRNRLEYLLDFYQVDALAIEMVASYGMPVGKTVFETCVEIGRFWQIAIKCQRVLTQEFVYRKDVKLTLCNSLRAKDANIRQALLDRYEPYGGGSIPQIGTKKEPGPLYGISKDLWAALAVAEHFIEKSQGIYDTT